ncbi:TetR/AcrR family transcriptional regulator [Dietzia cinnamea]|uniref:TetR/AcrR family transcriptional regulator n=1 Tax=Dietzia cinnamea TaxID=321318 RepID=A0ABV3YJH9_9ACTN|nr:TetR/AcrR family transcriptional regulator [Dietzia cinnamea]MCT1641227.1 TetR/AcrR family transcriptional regulator [Dietzia cinnamea]MCT2140178.1 TetR/AcrR family transcriptional regulator [Dietzia cinnamea]
MSGSVKRRRPETRQRLLDAALEVFAERGFGNSSVEQVCGRAGFTRGAFYSNFTSLEELFLAMWEQRSTQILADVGALLDTGEPLPVSSLDDVVAHVLAVVPVDDQWFRVNAEFTAHALRNPSLKRVLVARERAILATLMPLLDGLLSQIGLEVTDRAALGPSLTAAHDGTLVQCLIEDDVSAALDRRAAMFTVLVERYTQEIVDA